MRGLLPRLAVLLGAFAGCASQEIETHPDVLADAFTRQVVRVELARFASEPAAFPGHLNMDLVRLDEQAAAAQRQLWVTLATSGFLSPVTAGQAREVGVDVSMEVGVSWRCRDSGGFGCDGLYSLTAHDPRGRLVWSDRIPLGRLGWGGGTTPDVFRLQAQHLMEDANRLAVRRLRAMLGPR